MGSKNFVMHFLNGFLFQDMAHIDDPNLGLATREGVAKV
jgi:hypothetical protein